MTTAATTIQPSTRQPTPEGEPVWEIAELFPRQGDWAINEYLALKTTRLVEFDHGRIEVLAMPTKTHQTLIFLLAKALEAATAGRGRVLTAGYPFRVGPQTFREPDVIYMSAEQDAAAAEQYTQAASLVMEVVSPDDPKRDRQLKRVEYANAGVAEYWIIDPSQREVLVLTLQASEQAKEKPTYTEHGQFRPADHATSALFEDLRVNVSQLFEGSSTR